MKNPEKVILGSKHAFMNLQIGVTKNWKQHECRKIFWQFLKIWIFIKIFETNVDKNKITAG